MQHSSSCPFSMRLNTKCIDWKLSSSLVLSWQGVAVSGDTSRCEVGVCVFVCQLEGFWPFSRRGITLAWSAVPSWQRSTHTSHLRGGLLYLCSSKTSSTCCTCIGCPSVCVCVSSITLLLINVDITLWAATNSYFHYQSADYHDYSLSPVLTNVRL